MGSGGMHTLIRDVQHDRGSITRASIAGNTLAHPLLKGQQNIVLNSLVT